MRFSAALSAVACVSLVACSLDHGPHQDGGGSDPGAVGGGAVGSPVDAAFDPAEDSSPINSGGGGALGTPACEGDGLTFQISPNATHRRASAAFAVAAVHAKTWPDINRSLLSHEEFLAFFSRSDQGSPFGRVRGAENGARILDVFVPPPATPPAPMHLILVVDTSTSMRNDLALAGDLVKQFGVAISAHADDHMTVIEWGSQPLIFEASSGDTTAPSTRAMQLGEDFAVRANELANAQLGPGASLGPAEQVVAQAIEVTQDTPHVVVITDGGIVADSDSFAAIEAWRAKQRSVVSFLEIAGPSGDASAAPTSFHREQLAALAPAGRGLTHFVTSETLPQLMADFDADFRISLDGAVPLYNMDGITDLIASADSDFASTGLGATVRPGWAAGRPMYTSVQVNSCTSEAFGATVKLGDGEPVAFTIGAPDDERVARLGYVDLLFQLLSGDCAGAPALILQGPLAALDAGNEDIQALVDEVSEICDL